MSLLHEERLHKAIHFVDAIDLDCRDRLLNEVRPRRSSCGLRRGAAACLCCCGVREFGSAKIGSGCLEGDGTIALTWLWLGLAAVGFHDAAADRGWGGGGGVQRV